MPRRRFKLGSIVGGMTPLLYGGQPKDSYEQAMGIDPDLPGNTTMSSRTAGIISPAGYAKFSSTEITGAPMFIVTNPKDQNTYIYCSDGAFIKYDSTLTSAGSTALTTPTSGAGNGMAYYNNYIYLATPTDIARYGPLDNSPALTQAWWTTAPATGLGLTALSNTTLPTIRQKALPNHSMKVHTDGFLYFCDVITTTYATTGVRGKGVIHRIGTKSDGTDQGKSDNGSAYDVLELPFGYLPVAIESYGTDLAILACTIGSSQTIRQGRASLFLWDTFAAIPYKQINIPDPIVSAVYNNNGALYVFSGNENTGVRLSVYTGGETMKQVAFFEDGVSPFQGAVDSFEDKLLFGGFSTYLGSESATCFSYRSKNSELPTAIHCPILTTSTGTTPVVTAVKYVQQASNILPRAVVGWVDSTTQGLDKFSASASLLNRFKLFLSIERQFSLRSLRYTLDRSVTSTVSISPIIYFDDLSDSQTPNPINNTNYSGDRVVVYKRPELAVVGKKNICIDHTWASTTPAAIQEIEIEWDEFDVQKTI